MNPTVTAQVDQYLDGVRAALADLPDETREELLEDLPGHLAEVVAEDTGTLEERLGTPAAYAAELRSAAGLEESQQPTVQMTTTTTTAIISIANRLAASLARLDTRLGPTVGYERLSDFGKLLRPAWWVLRGYVAAMVIMAFAGGTGSLLPYAFGRYGGGNVLGALVGWAIALGGVAISVRIGSGGDGMSLMRRWLFRGVTTVLVLIFTITVFSLDNHLDGDDYPVSYARTQSVQDIYVYDSNGNPLTGIQLYDEYGNPLTFGYEGRCNQDSPRLGSYSNGAPMWSYPLCPIGPATVPPVAPRVPAFPSGESASPRTSTSAQPQTPLSGSPQTQQSSQVSPPSQPAAAAAASATPQRS